MILVHKKSLGIIEWLPWDGSYTTANMQGERVPVYRRVKRSNIDILDIELSEYWILEDEVLERQVRMYYPFFYPEINEDGQLIGIKPWEKYKKYGERKPTENQKKKEKELIKPKKKRKRITVKF